MIVGFWIRLGKFIKAHLNTGAISKDFIYFKIVVKGFITGFKRFNGRFEDFFRPFMEDLRNGFDENTPFKVKDLSLGLDDKKDNPLAVNAAPAAPVGGLNLSAWYKCPTKKTSQNENR